MKNNYEKRVKSKLLNIGKKNRVLGILLVPILFIVMSCSHIVQYLADNRKRFAFAAMSLFLFTVYSSFSFPAFINAAEEELYSLDVDGMENVSLAQETELNMDEVKLLDDNDVLSDSDYSGTAHGYALMDKYEAEDILESTVGRELNAAENGAEELPNGAEDDSVVFSRDDWRLVLINKQNSIPEDYSFTLGTIKGSMQCDERIIDDVLNMLQAAKVDGVNLIICSPYRDMERQQMLFNRKIKRYVNQGMSYMEAYQLSSEAVTVPGASEHQIGLALDIVCNGYTALDAGFGETEAGKWLAEHSCEYGFILRYPLGKEYITGIEYEPWHFRYVGKDAATVITEKKITLEEFWEDL